MTKRHWTIFLLPCVLFAACTTAALWKKTDPFDLVWVDPNSVSEEELKNQHVSYQKAKYGYLIEKDSVQKLKDVALRSIGTPVTILVDGAMAVGIVAVALGAGCAQDPGCVESAVGSIPGVEVSDTRERMP